MMIDFHKASVKTITVTRRIDIDGQINKRNPGGHA